MRRAIKVRKSFSHQAHGANGGLTRSETARNSREGQGMEGEAGPR